MTRNWFRYFTCCCDKDYSAHCDKKEQQAHLYCGCRDRRKLGKMTCEAAGVGNDKQNLVDTESASDVLAYNFVAGTKREKWEVDSPILKKYKWTFPFLMSKHTLGPTLSIMSTQTPYMTGTTPFAQHFDQPLHPGDDIVIQGAILPNTLRCASGLDLDFSFFQGCYDCNCFPQRKARYIVSTKNSFAVNLCMGDEDCIAFHFNPRLDQGYTARNSKFSGKWGLEEGISHQGFPFERNKLFGLEIFLTHSEFLVAVNGIHYCAYTYRAPLSDIELLEVVGDIDIKRIVLDVSETYPSNLLYSLEPAIDNRTCRIATEPGTAVVTRCESKNTPFVGIFDRPLRFGSTIEIAGTVKLLPYVFTINLQQGPSVFPHPVINLHISVRFNQLAHAGNHVVLFNAWGDEQGWGNEEILSCSFIPGSDFKLLVSCHEDAFVTYLNDQPMFTFKHRYDFNRVDTLYIQGEIFMKQIKVKL